MKPVVPAARRGIPRRGERRDFDETAARLTRILSFAGLLLAAIELPADDQFPKPGEWPCDRRTGTLEAHSPLRGHLTRPRHSWKQFVGVLESLVVVEPGNRNTRLDLSETNPPTIAVPVTVASFLPKPGSAYENQGSPTVTFADVLADDPGPEKIEFESAFNKPTVNGGWQPGVGRCLARRNDQWVQVWETPPLQHLFQPLPLAGDFDGDGAPEVAILPFYELVLLDARTGRIKDRCRFTDTRSYGFFGVYDFDGDGRSEFLIQADFSKHIDVLGFRDGKLGVLWQRSVEPDISNPRKIVRVGPNPVAELDGDGRAEVITSLFNDSADGRWHLTIHDAMTGRTKAEWPDEILAAALDLDGDGVSELLTTGTSGGGVPELGTVRVRSLKGGQARLLWERKETGWQTWEPPLPVNVKSTATLGQRTVLCQIRGSRAHVVLRESRSPTQTKLSVARWDGSTFKPVTAVVGENLEALGFEATGRLLVRCRHQPGRSSRLFVTHGSATSQGTSRLGGAPGPAIVAWPDGATEPTVVVQGVGEELVAFHPAKGDEKTLRLNRWPGRGQSSAWPRTSGPVVADLAGDGRRQLILADAGPSGCARMVARDLGGPIRWRREFPQIPGTPPVWNMGGIVLWQAGHFTDQRRQDVLVTIRRSMMHSEETLLLSGKDGRVLWHRDRQISQRGVGGTPFALSDYDGDGLDDAASLHPSILYLLNGITGRDILAREASWEEVPAKPVYWGQPVAGKFLGPGEPALFLGGRSLTGLIRRDGTLAWWDAMDKSPSDLQAFGDFDGDGRSDGLGVGYEDGVRCYDTASGKVKWRMPRPAEGAVTGAASADLDSDGRDEALLAMGRILFCLGTSGDAGLGVRWQVEFPTPIGPPAVATLNRDDRVSILVVGSDGYVYCLE